MAQSRRGRPPVAVRRLRGALFAGTAAALAIAAHGLAGGGWPGMSTLAIVAVLVALAAGGFTGRRSSALAVAAALAGAQLAMHMILDTASTHHDQSSVADGRTMLAAHAIATLLSAIVLAQADGALSAVWTVARAVLPRIPVTPPVPSPEPVIRCVALPAADMVRRVVLRESCARRGPPTPRWNG